MFLLHIAVPTGYCCLRICLFQFLLLFIPSFILPTPLLLILLPSLSPKSVHTYCLMSYLDTFFSTVRSLKFTQGVLTNEPGAPVCPSEVAPLTTRKRANTRRERIAKHTPRLFGVGRCLKWHTLQIFSTAAHTDAHSDLVFCVCVRVCLCLFLSSLYSQGQEWKQSVADLSIVYLLLCV